MRQRPVSVLLVQVREPGDRMAAHEQACIRRRLHAVPVSLTVRNALADRLDPAALDPFDGFILGGSGAHSVHDPRSAGWLGPLRALLERGLERRTPGFGICFGHQLLGHHLGATVRTDPAKAELGTVAVSLTTAGRDDALLGTLPAHFRAQTGHSDCVLQVPAGVDLLADNEHLRTQAFRVRGAPFRSAQLHPDMTAAEARERFIAYSAGFGQAVGHDVSARAAAFRPSQDDTMAILAHFVQLVSQEEPR